MQDKVELFIDKKVIEHFISYTIDADLYIPADAFRLQFANPRMEIKTGMPCEIRINGKKELTGIIDKVEKTVDKSGTKLSVEGRDLMGLLVDSYCEEFITIENKKIDKIAEALLAKLVKKNPQFLSIDNISYQENVAGTGKSRSVKSGEASALSAEEEVQQIAKIEPGMTIFQVLKNMAQSRGLLFWCEPDGHMIIGRPMAKGAPSFFITLKKDGIGNNVIRSVKSMDISKRYSQVTVIGQRQGMESDGDQLSGAEKINTPSGTETDEFPFYKPYVAVNRSDPNTLQKHARTILEKQRRDGEKLTYTVGRHHQVLSDGVTQRNWRFNAFCKVVDETQGLNGEYLIYGRTFELSKQSGPTTTVHLGPPGLIE